MITANLYAAWIGILLGCLGGAVQGLFFRKENWLGGYGSWTRRMMRLGHISFMGIALINIAFAMTASKMGIENEIYIPSVLFIIAAVGMPLVEIGEWMNSWIPENSMMESSLSSTSSRERPSKAPFKKMFS